MQQTVKERIMDFINSSNLSIRGFETKCGLSNGYLRQLRNSPTVDKIEMIISAYPELNREWLMTGEGSMLKEGSGNAKLVGGVYPVEQKDSGIIMVDYVPVTASASFVESLGNATRHQFEKFPLVPRGGEASEADKLCIFEVEGDSMYPTIPSGALILAKEIPERTWHYAEGVVVAVYDEYVVVKRVGKNALLTDNYMVLRSDNIEYGEMTVQLADIRALYKARRIISSAIR